MEKGTYSDYKCYCCKPEEIKMIALGSKSYPYLAVAQYYNIDYGEVLSFSDIVENKNLPLDAILNLWQIATLEAWYNEKERRNRVSGV